MLAVAEREEGADVVSERLRRLAKAQVELAAARPRDHDEDAVEHRPPLLVEVQPQVEEMPEEMSALGQADSEDGVDRAGARVAGGLWRRSQP